MICRQPCSIMRRECIHPCAAPCHSGSPCPNTPCNAMVTLKCSCGRREEQVECGKDNVYKNTDFLQPNSDSVDIGKLLKQTKISHPTTLTCDETCAVAERNRRLAEALQIADPERTNSNKTYSEFLMGMAKKDPVFIRGIERELCNLVESVEWMGFQKQNHNFPDMKSEKRHAIHELAECFGCKSEAFDVEPKRYVMVTAIKGSSKTPTPLLSEAAAKEAQNSNVTATSTPTVVQRNPAPKGRLLSSMKLVSLSSYDNKKPTGAGDVDKKSTAASPAAPVRKVYRKVTPTALTTPKKKLSDLSNFSASVTASNSRLGISSPRSSPTMSSSSGRVQSATPAKKTPEPAKEIDYFDMTD